MKNRHAPSSGNAFTRIELIFVLALGGLLLALALPAGADARSAAASAVCQSNHRQLIRAWLMFAQDNSGALPGNHDGGNARTNLDWCAGWLTLGADNADNTNTLNLNNGQVGRYLGRDFTVFKCPEDTSTSRNGGVVRPRVRSVSMNAYMGVRVSPYTGGYWQFQKLSAIISPAPAAAFVFTDEREDSINDGVFELDMTGFSPRNPAAYILVDFPADWHEGGDTFSFADGHVEAWTWRDARTLPVHKQGQYLSLAQSSGGNPDVARLQAGASSKIVP
jgi:prepilin-type processing-associated H-X9-DG protein